MGNTAVMCTVQGPYESSGWGNATEAVVEVSVNIAGFAGVDRKRRVGGPDRYGEETTPAIPALQVPEKWSTDWI